MVSSSPSIRLSSSCFDDQKEDSPNQSNEEYSFDYDRFLLRMKHPDCRHIVTKIKYFIHEFNKWSDDDQEKPIKYKEFMEWTGEALLAHPVWQAAPSKYRQDIKEGLEYLIMNQIYPSAFAPSTDMESDKHFSLQLHRHQWLEPKHLDISHPLIINDQLVEHAKSELKNLSNLTTPRDKLFCIMTFCRIIESSLEVHDKKMDADKLMPLIILVLLKVQPRHLISNMRYVQRYRATVHFKSEIGYHFTNLMAAITFIERINRDALVMIDDCNDYDNHEDYEEKIREMGEFIEHQSPKSTLNSSSSISNTIHHDDHGYISSLDEKDYHHHHLANDESDDDILEEGKRVFHKIKSSRVISKSIGYLREMMTKAEEAINDALKEAISDDINMSASNSNTTNRRNNNNNRDEEENEEEKRLRKIEEDEEDEFQLQLAMALSLSEHQHQHQHQHQRHQEQITQNNNIVMKKRSSSM